MSQLGAGLDKLNSTQQLVGIYANSFSPRNNVPRSNAGTRVLSQQQLPQHSNKNIKTFKHINS